MNPVELLDSAYEPAANSSPRLRLVAGEHDERAAAARGLMIQLVTREIQLAERSPAWLRTIAEQLVAIDEPELARECERLADGTRGVRAELVVLVHRLVARRNRLNPSRRVDVIAVLGQPRSPVVDELIAALELEVAAGDPRVALAGLRAIERTLADGIPLAFELTGVHDGDLVEAVDHFCGRRDRAEALSAALTKLIDADSKAAAIVRAAEQQAIAAYNRVLSECGEIGRELDDWRHGLIRY